MKVIQLLPFENYTLITSLGTTEINARIAGRIEPKKVFRLKLFNSSPTKPYEGEITGDTFKINRILNHRNSFLPIITGNMTYSFKETRVKIKMRPSIIVIVFISVWLGILGRDCALILLRSIFPSQEVSETNFERLGLVPFVMFIFGWLLLFISFKTESKKSKKFLALLIEGEEINN